MRKEVRTFTTCTNCKKAILNPSTLQRQSIQKLRHRPIHADWRKRFNSESCQQSLEGLVEFEDVGETGAQSYLQAANSAIPCHFCKALTVYQEQLQACVLDI